MITLSHVSKIYHQGQPNELHALRDLNLTIDAEGITCLRGASGSGKTTLLSLIGCLSRPTSGRIALQGQIISSFSERFLTDIRRHTFGFIFQRFNLISGLSVIDNVMIPAYPIAPDHDLLYAKATELLHHFGLATRLHSRVEWLSGGESQRVAICRALINDPTIIIADEPTANLDSKLTAGFLSLMAELAKNGKSIILSSHDPGIYDAQEINHLIEMRDGRLLSQT
ncbi:MAG: ABC transporter ATP-binding protein [Gammaproteobacteria bacterium]|nr:ABC transporter ATP-binding protein [Gammaproteobacteria bacterium]